MTRTLLALAALAVATPAMAQGYYAPNNQSIYGGGSGGYQWHDTAPVYSPPQFQFNNGYIPRNEQPIVRRGTTCSWAGNGSFCD